jgi:hypothetical protein
VYGISFTLTHEQFPWFRKATIDQVCHADRPTKDRLYWPELDIDLSIESIRKPSNFPFVVKSTG